MQRPLVGIALGFVTGVIGSSLWSVPIGIFIGFFMMANLFGTWWFYRYRKGLFVILFVLGFGIGGVRFVQVDQANQSHLEPFLTKPICAVGEIASPPKRNGDQSVFDFTILRVRLNHTWVAIPREKIRLSIKLSRYEEVKRVGKLQRFDTILTTIQLKPVSLPRNPGAFDYRTYLYRQGIHWLGEVNGLSTLTVLDKSAHPYVYIDRFREFLAFKIEGIYPSSFSGMVRGMLLGEREQVDPKIVEDYSALGIIHLLSISGLHVGVLVATLYFLLMLLGLTREKAAMLILCMLPIYAVLTGAGAPVVRSCIMAMLVMLALLLLKFKDALSFLSLALLLQLLWDPYQIFGAGFQLSFLLTAALIVGVPVLVDKVRTPWNWFNHALCVTIVAQIASFPILIYHFHSFSVLSWLVNLIVVPLFSLLVIPLSLLALVVSFFSHSLGQFVASLSTYILYSVDAISAFFLQFPWARMSWAQPSIVWILCYTVAACYLWTSCIGCFFYRRHLMMALSLYLGVTLYAHQAEKWFCDETRVTFLDVGQGDCAVIETREGKVILVDGGGSPSFQRPNWKTRRNSWEVGARVVVPYLQYRGIREVDYMIMTHGDADHIGGLQAVADKFPVHRVLRNAHAPHTKVEKKLMETLTSQGSKIYTPPRGLNWELEQGIEWEFLHPDPQHHLGDDQHSNDDSVVCLLSIYGKKVLFTGDIGVEAEKEILSHWKIGPVDVLKVAHHGSKYSTGEEWLESIQAKEAVISVGEKNRYGHPTKEVLERLRLHHVSAFRTDQLGAVTYHFKPQNVDRETMLAA